MGFICARPITDHGQLSGLGDDDHAQYLKEAASGGLASETPTHTHQGATQCGKLDHGLALDGLADDDHLQYFPNDGRPYVSLDLQKINDTQDGGRMHFKQGPTDKIQEDINLDRYNGDLRFSRNDSDSDPTWIRTQQYGSGGAVYFESQHLSWVEHSCALCGRRFKPGDRLTIIVTEILDGHTLTVPICKECFLQ
jgi:hypothetical protein